jgi:hypothetical protein
MENFKAQYRAISNPVYTVPDREQAQVELVHVSEIGATVEVRLTVEVGKLAGNATKPVWRVSGALYDDLNLKKPVSLWTPQETLKVKDVLQSVISGAGETKQQKEDALNDNLSLIRPLREGERTSLQIQQMSKAA